MRGIFLNVDPRWSGSFHDGRVLRICQWRGHQEKEKCGICLAQKHFVFLGVWGLIFSIFRYNFFKIFHPLDKDLVMKILKYFSKLCYSSLFLLIFCREGTFTGGGDNIVQ